jgi:hypothetical protein
VHFYLQVNKKRDVQNALPFNTIQAPIQFLYIANNYRFHIQSKERHIDRANILPANRPASVQNWQCVVLSTVLRVLPYWRELS